MRAPSFRPLPSVFANPHAQTLLGNLVSLAKAPPAGTVRVALEDGDALALEVSTPPGWAGSDPTVVLVHGLGGSHESTYMVRLAAKLFARGVRAVRLNLRGQGTGRGLARRPYHGGTSADLGAALAALKRSDPASPVSVAGFSLGGNITLKWAGEAGGGAGDLVDRVVAVCPSVDLWACWNRLNRPENALYQRTFVRELRQAARELQALFPDQEPVRLPRRRGLTLFEFDDAYTAPRWGFAGARDYYDRASAAPHMAGVDVPTHVLVAEDDPIICPQAFDRLDAPAAVELHRVPRGGHLGFLSSPRAPGGHRFMDAVVLRWLGLSTG